MRDGTLISFLQRLIARPEFGPFVLLIGEIVAFTMRSPAFLSAGNISNSLAFTPELGMIALGMTLLLVVRGTALYITSGFPQRTWAANSPLMAIIVGEFSIGELRIHTSLLWFI